MQRERLGERQGQAALSLPDLLRLRVLRIFGPGHPDLSYFDAGPGAVGKAGDVVLVTMRRNDDVDAWLTVGLPVRGGGKDGLHDLVNCVGAGCDRAAVDQHLRRPLRTGKENEECVAEAHVIHPDGDVPGACRLPLRSPPAWVGHDRRPLTARRSL